MVPCAGAGLRASQIRFPGPVAPGGRLAAPSLSPGGAIRVSCVFLPACFPGPRRPASVKGSPITPTRFFTTL